MNKEKPKFKCFCDPSKIKIQEYQSGISVNIPPTVILRKNTPDREVRENVGIDSCLAYELNELWKLGIATTGCCCGHNQSDHAYIGVEEQHIGEMLDLGYEVIDRPEAPGKER